MTRTKTVRLEILRHGPPHNQLLSPLTQYLALCGNHCSVTVRVPYEHAQFLSRHNALSYQMTHREGDDKAREQRELQLQMTAQEMAQLLSDIPGLISELRASGTADEFIHFELVLSASELALLPFELTNAPNGFPGTGQPLILQSQSPLCMTRRVNRVDNDRYHWPDNFKILFVESLPDRDAERLVPAHLLALREAIDPWVGRSSHDSDASELPVWVTRKLTVLRRASVEAVFRALRRDRYTHIHILAHGVSHSEGVDRRFGLQMRSDQNPGQFDNVSASRLTALMRSFQDSQASRLSHPAVLTIASCHGAGQGSVVGAGSSIAHALHEAQIPLVVSAQFPLSFRASVMMVQTLYGGLLRGEDPRFLLNDLRRRLKSQIPNSHDWASLVAYTALPENIGVRLQQVRYQQALRSIEAAFSFSDDLSSRWYARDEALTAPTRTFREDGSMPASDPQTRDQSKTLYRRLADAKSHLKRLRGELEEDGGEEQSATQLAFVAGRLASTEKRQSEIEFRNNEVPEGESSPSFDWLESLKRSRDYYQAAFAADRSQTWALVQELVLRGVCEDWKRGQNGWRQFHFWPGDKVFRLDRLTALALTRQDQKSGDRTRRGWTLGNRIELELTGLRCATDSSDIAAAHAQVRRRLFGYVQRMRSLLGNDDWQWFSTRRQLKRYLNWFFYPCPPSPQPSSHPSIDEVPALINGLCQSLLEQLPDLGSRH